MRALDRKLLRDLWGVRGQAAAIAIVMACGVAVFVMSLSTLESLRETRAAYYDRERFAHVFAQLKRAPRPLLERIADIDGVAAVEGRVVTEVVLNVPDMVEPAVGRLISIPASGEPAVNGLYVRRGRLPEPYRRGEVAVGEAFAAAHGFGPGDELTAVIRGSWERLRIVGVVLSPEYVFQIRGGSFLPDDKRFAVMWMAEDQLEAAADMDGAFNDVAVRLMRGASEARVMEAIDRLTEPYGGTGSHGRDEQVSARYLSDELTQLRATALITPSIFLGVAAFLVHMVLSRIIGTQREQIAAIKAFGYGRRAIGLHYLKFAGIIAAVGALLGVLAGMWLGGWLTVLYTRYYRFPELFFRLDPGVVALAVTICAAIALIGTAGSVAAAMRLPPAEAMRPEPPARYRSTFLERIGLGAWLWVSARMVLRHLERRPIKSGMSALGIAFAAAVLVLGSFSEDALDFIVEHEFRRVHRYDVSVAFIEPSDSATLFDLAHLPGVRRVEGFRAAPVRLRFGSRSRLVSIIGLDPGRTLFVPRTADGMPVDVPPGGLVLSEKLAEVLGARPGEQVSVEIKEGRRLTRPVQIARLVSDYSGTNAYMDRAALAGLLRDGPTVSGAYLRVAPERAEALYNELKQTPRVAAVDIKKSMLDSFDQTVAENIRIMRFFNIMFASIIAFGVVYNTTRVTLAEQSRELATMRVMGFTRREVSGVLLGQLGVLTAVGVPIGLGIGSLMAWGVVSAWSTELYRFPLVLDAGMLARSALIVAAAAWVSGLIVRRRVDRLDMIAVLKAQE